MSPLALRDGAGAAWDGPTEDDLPDACSEGLCLVPALHRGGAVTRGARPTPPTGRAARRLLPSETPGPRVTQGRIRGCRKHPLQPLPTCIFETPRPTTLALEGLWEFKCAFLPS